MAVTYSTAAKNARLQAIIDLIDAGAGAGKLKIRDGSNVVLATLALADPCGSVSGGVLTFDFTPAISDTSADASGTAANAIVTDDADTTIVSGLTVGPASTAWAGSTAYTAGQYVNNGGNLYICTTGGTSASSGGPTGTGSGISDGTAAWDYVSAKPDIGLDSVSITAGQTVTLTTGAITHAA